MVHKLSQSLLLRSPGFFLLELLLAFMVLCVGALGIARYQGRIAQMQEQARFYLQATNVARDFFESLRIMGALPVASTRQVDDFTVTWRAYEPKKITLPFSDMTATFAQPFTMVKVTVSWKTSDGFQRSIAMVSGLTVQKTAKG